MQSRLQVNKAKLYRVQMKSSARWKAKPSKAGFKIQLKHIIQTMVHICLCFAWMGTYFWTIILKDFQNGSLLPQVPL